MVRSTAPREPAFRLPQLISLQLLCRTLRSRWHLGLRAALSVGIPLAAGVCSGRPGWGAVASFGGFAGFYATDAPRRHRTRVVAGVGVALTIVVPLGTVCSSRPWLAVFFAGAVAAVSSFVFLGLQVPPPREYLIVLAALAATGIPGGLTGALREGALVACGAAMACIVALTPTLGRRRLVPQARSLRQAWSAVAAVLDAAGTAEAERSREHALVSIGRARDVLGQAGSHAADLRSLAAAEIILAPALSLSIDASRPLDPRWAAAVRRLADRSPDMGASAGPAPRMPADAPGLCQALAEASCLLQDRDPEQEATGVGRRGTARQLREALSPHALVVPAAARIGIIVAAGTGVGRLLGLDHSYWVGLTATAVLQANNVAFLIRRSVNRVAGTIAGVGLAGLVLATHPAIPGIIGVVICAQLVSEVLMPVSYALAVSFITVVALAIYDLATSGASIGAAVDARVLDTLIGAALAVMLRLILWPRTTAARLPQVQAATLRAAATVFRSRWVDDQTDLRAAQNRLQDRLLYLRAVQQDALADRRLVAPATSSDQVTPAIAELAWLALGIPLDRKQPTRLAAEALLRRLEELADSLQSGSAPPRITGLPTLPGHPRTQAAARLLEAAIG